MGKQDLTQERLKEALNYDPETGVFTWRVAVSNKAIPGQRAGQSRTLGYRAIGLFGERYLEHRLAVLYVTGRWPEDEVDHVNGDTSDNRWANLRECVHAENHQNRKTPAHSVQRVMGVTWHKLRSKWRAAIVLRGKQHHLGLFPTKEEAHQAYLTAKAQLHTFQPTPRT